MISDWILFGIWNSYRQSFRIWSESWSFLFNIIGMIKFFSLDKAKDPFGIYNVLRFFEMAIFLRLIRILTLLYELRTFRNIIETIKNLLGPFWSLLLVQFTIFYEFGLVGMGLFGGEINTQSS